MSTLPVQLQCPVHKTGKARNESFARMEERAKIPCAFSFPDKDVPKWTKVPLSKLTTNYRVGIVSNMASELILDDFWKDVDHWGS